MASIDLFRDTGVEHSQLVTIVAKPQLVSASMREHNSRRTQPASSPCGSILAFFARRFISLFERGFSASSAAASDPREAFRLRLSTLFPGCVGAVADFPGAFCFDPAFSVWTFSPPWTMSTIPRQLVRFSLASAVTFRASSQMASLPRSCDRPHTQVKLITSHGARSPRALRASLDTIMPRPRVARIKAMAFPIRFRRASRPLPVTPGP